MTKPNGSNGANRSHYDSALQRRGGVNGNETPVMDAQMYAARELINVTRRLLVAGGTIEEGLDCVLEAARREFMCRIVALAPARLRIDGADYLWPLALDS